MLHKFRILKVVSIAVMCAGMGTGASMAGQKPEAKGGVVLTVAGKVSNWNRGAMVPGRDNLFNRHKISFEKAMAFDNTMLAGLPPQKLEVSTPAGNGTFSGPSLADVLKASGAEGAKVRLVSLDGSKVELSPEDVKAHNWMLALSVDGKPVGIGDFGPLWLLHKPVSGAAPSPEEMQQWGWSVFFIEVL